MKWETRSCERPRKRSASEALPSSVSNRYFLSIRTHGSSCRRRASSSLRRVSSFSALSRSSRAASHSSRVPVMCFVIALLSFLRVSFIVRSFRLTFGPAQPSIHASIPPPARSRRGARYHLGDHRGDLPFRGLRRGRELSAKIHREPVREDVLLPGLNAVKDRERHVARRGLRQRKLTGHVSVNGARVDAEDRGALRPEEDTRGLGQGMERGLRSAVGRE